MNSDRRREILRPSLVMAFERVSTMNAAHTTPVLSSSGGWGGSGWDASGLGRPATAWRRPALFALPLPSVALEQLMGFGSPEGLLYFARTDWGRSVDDREACAAAAVLLRMKNHDTVQGSAPSPRKRLRTPEKPSRERAAAAAGSTPSNKPLERKSKRSCARRGVALEPIKTTNTRSKSRFRGVSWVQRDQKFVAQITSKRKNTFLGSFRTEVTAGQAYALAVEMIAADPQWTRPPMAQWLQCLTRSGVTSLSKYGRGSGGGGGSSSGGTKRSRTRTQKRGRDKAARRASGSNPQSPFAGVCWDRISQKWQARCSIGGGKRTHVGFYACDKDARDAIALRYAELELREP